MDSTDPSELAQSFEAILKWISGAKASHWWYWHSHHGMFQYNNTNNITASEQNICTTNYLCPCWDESAMRSWLLQRRHNHHHLLLTCLNGMPLDNLPSPPFNWSLSLTALIYISTNAKAAYGTSCPIAKQHKHKKKPKKESENASNSNAAMWFYAR